MKKVTAKELEKRLRIENPWWEASGAVDEFYRTMQPRAYNELFYRLVRDRSVHRAVVLMGPLRVGKTVMIHHTVQRLIEEGEAPERICYVSIDAPVYSDFGLEDIVDLYRQTCRMDDIKGCVIFFDEIQYLKNWEIHLKRCVDDYKHTRFIVSGSAAAALKLKSTESGAGRFTDFLLPPLTFYEYLMLVGKSGLMLQEKEAIGDRHYSVPRDIQKLNAEFINYLNYGGYPEALFSETIRMDPGRFIRSDIIDKVLSRDLPSLYGIQDIHELNRLFAMLAYNTGNEVSLDELSTGSGVAKSTLKKYIEYLEAAFLITILHRVDQSGRTFKKEHYFKVYLTNPSMRCALYDPVNEESEVIGNMVETAIISQWLHSEDFRNQFYSRWGKGREVDLVYRRQDHIHWCGEIKWSDRHFTRLEELKDLCDLCNNNKVLLNPLTTTKSIRGVKKLDGITIKFVEASVYCYTVGAILIQGRTARMV